MPYKYNDVTILVRARAQILEIEKALKYHAIPYKIVGGASFFDTTEIRVVVNFISWIQNTASTYDLSRVVTSYAAGLGASAVSKLYGETPSTSIDDLITTCKKIGQNKPNVWKSPKWELLNEYLEAGKYVKETGMRLHQTLSWLDNKFSIREMLEDQDKNDPKKTSNRVENFESLSEAMDDCTLDEFLDQVALISTADEPEEEDRVTISTIHAFKGKESPVIMIPGMAEGIYPHKMSMDSDDPEDLEQEKNAYYVAKTRAKNMLVMTRPLTMKSVGKHMTTQRSRFINSNMKALQKYAQVRLL
jgi:DNA helicase-2/ATP-dependent DNA helicase PcrA